ncbi:MAG: type II toxin-antitoxin system HicB family antitoxin [Oxalobacter sp.]|nr:type II toxin-antitoxin system HicB family antitoxin [Oxalobacter sp.]
MKYPIVIELGDAETAHAVYVPDLDVATAGDTIEDCYKAAVEAADVEMGNFVRMGKEIPMPSNMADIMDREEYKGFQFGLVDIDITPFLGKTERLTITLPSRVVSAIDEHVRMYGLKSRSAFIADAAMAGISR